MSVGSREHKDGLSNKGSAGKDFPHLRTENLIIRQMASYFKLLAYFSGFDTPPWSKPVGQLASALNDNRHRQIWNGSEEPSFVKFKVRRIYQFNRE